MNRDRSAGVVWQAARMSLLLAGLLQLAAVAVSARDSTPAGTLTPGQLLNSLNDVERAWPREHSVITVARHPDWAPLAGILGKAVASTPETERAEVYPKAVPIRHEDGVDHALSWKVLAGFAVIVLSLVVWNRRLAREITQRKGAEETLRETQEKYQHLIETTATGYVIIDHQGRVTDANQEYARLTGRRRLEDVLSHSVLEWTAPRDLERNAAELKKCFEQGFVRNLELDYITPAGQITPVEINATLLRRRDAVMVLSLCRDITQRKRAQEQSRLDESRLEGLLALNQKTGLSTQEIALFAMEEAVRLTQSTIGYIAFVNEDETVLTMQAWSQAAMRECQVLNKPLVYPVATTGLWGEAIRQRRAVITNDYGAPNPLKKGIPEGHVRLARHMNVPIFDGDHIVIVAGVGNKPSNYDATDVRQLTLLMDGMWRTVRRKQAEEALREKTEELDRFFSTTLDMLCIADTDGFFRRLNPQWEAVLGFAPHELVGTRFMDLVHPEDVEATKQAISRLDAQQPVLNFANRYRCKDGSYRWLEWRSSPQGKLIYAAAHDITERKRTEEMLLRVNKAVECASDAIGMADSQGHHFYQNRAFTDLFEYKMEEIDATGGEPAGYVDKNLAREVFATIMSGGSWSGEVEMKSKSGRTFPVWMRADAIKDEDGRVIGLVGVHTDISERQRAAEALRYRADFERVLLHISAQLMALMPEEVDAAVNRALADVGRFAGVDRCYAFRFRDQNTFADNTHEWCAEGIEPQLPRLQGLAVADFPSLAGAVTHGQPVCVSRVKDLPPASAERQELEREGIQSLVLVPMVCGGEVLGFLGIDSVRMERVWGEDLVDLLKITGNMIMNALERKRAEEALRESMKRLQTVVTGAPVVLYSFDRHGIFTVSEGKGLVGLGLKPGEIVGRSVFDVYGNLPEAIAALRRALAGETFTLELSFPAGGTFEASHIALRDAAGDYDGTIGVMVDITERKRMEEAFRRSEANLQLALDAARMGDWSWDIVTGEVLWSARCKALYGLAPDTVVTYERFLACLHPEDRARIDAALRRAVAERSDYDVEKRAIWPDGSVHWNATRGRVFCNAAGEPVRIAGITLDITERKQAEAVAQESQERLGLALQGADLGSWDWNVQTGEVRVNERWAQMLGCRADEIEPHMKTWEDLVHPEDLPRVRQVLQAHLDGRTPSYETEHRMRHKSGGWVWVLDRGRVITRDAAGKPLRATGTHLDITERKRAEEALRESEERFAVFMENLPAGAFMKDVPGAVVYANRYLCDLFGWGKAVDRSTHDLLPPEVAEKMEADDRAALAQGLLTVTEQVRDAANRVRIFQTSKFPIARAGRRPLLGGIAVDVTERIQAEEALRASIEEKVVLLKEVHHRVKNNLQIISSLLNLQARKVRSPEFQTFLRDTQGRIRAMSLLHETLYGSGNLARVRFRDYVQTVCSQILRSYASDSRSIHLRQDVAEVMLRLDQAIPAGLILNELVSNALKHAFADRARGEVTVRLQVADERHYALSVADDGVGLPAGAGSRHPGTLGMRLVEGLVRQLEGKLTVIREPGTAFQIIFPTQDS